MVDVKVHHIYQAQIHFSCGNVITLFTSLENNLLRLLEPVYIEYTTTNSSSVANNFALPLALVATLDWHVPIFSARSASNSYEYDYGKLE